MTVVYLAQDQSPVNFDTLNGLNVVVSVPAAFGSTCTEQCVPGILETLDTLKEANVQRVIVVASDPPMAIEQWIKDQGWEESGIQFASDYGSFQLRQVVGKLSDEDGKEGMPQVVGNLLRRAYMLVKDGHIVWKFVEPDTGRYTLQIDELLQQIERHS